MNATIKIISSADIARCPIRSLLPAHYDADGSCHCSGPATAPPARSCTVCTEPLDYMDSPSVTRHTGCCDHENIEEAFDREGNSRRGEAWCVDCGGTVHPELDEDGFPAFVLQ